MKVNQGNIYIDSNNYDVKDVLYNVLTYFHPSRRMVEIEVSRILNEQGKRRISSANIPMNVYKNSTKWEKAFESDELSENIVYRMMQIISFNDDKTKRAIILYMMTNGFHRMYDNFGLLTEFKNNPEWDYNDLQKKAEENKVINQLIEDERTYSNNLAQEEIKKFMEWLQVTFGSEFTEWFNSRIGETILTNDAKFDIYSQKRTIISHLKDMVPDVDQSLINQLSDWINEIRIKSRRYYEPTVANLLPMFGMSENTYRTKRDASIRNLVSILGADLLRYALTKNEEEN